MNAAVSAFVSVSAFVFVLAFLVVLPAGNLLSPTPPSTKGRHRVQRRAGVDVRVPHVHPRSGLRWALATTLLLTASLSLHAQGCTQCLDSTRATPPQVQAAYRHAILLLGGFASTIFVSGAVLLRRTR